MVGKEATSQTPRETEAQLILARFLDEFAKGDPKRLILSWDENGNLAKILPEVVALKGVEQRPDHHLEGDVWTHTIMTLGFLPPEASLDLRLATLFHDIGKPQTTEVDLRRDKISSHRHEAVGAKIADRIIDRFSLFCPQIILDKKRIVWLVEHHLTGQGSGGDLMRKSTIQRVFLANESWGDDLRALQLADTLGRNPVNTKPKLATWDAAGAQIAGIKAEMAREATPPPPIPNGHRIMEIFGLSPSPAVGQILEALRQLYNELGFDSPAVGEGKAIFLHETLRLPTDTKRIPAEQLSRALQTTLQQISKERRQPKIETVKVLVSQNEDPITPKEIVGNLQEYQLIKAEARVLQKRQVRLVVLGPPRSGKTSFVSSLTGYLKELGENLPFPLGFQMVDLDKSRQDLTRLGGMSVQKERWTRRLARQAQKDLLANIILADGPGGKPDDITENIIRFVNYAVLLVAGENDRIFQERRMVWKKFLEAQRLPLIAEFRSRPLGQVKDSPPYSPVESELRLFVPGGFIGGQIVGLEFGAENKDPAIEDVAKILLFNILPALTKESKSIKK